MSLTGHVPVSHVTGHCSRDFFFSARIASTISLFFFARRLSSRMSPEMRPFTN